MHLLPNYANITTLTITAKSKLLLYYIILYYLFVYLQNLANMQFITYSTDFVTLVKYFNICSLDIFTLFQNEYIYFFFYYYYKICQMCKSLYIQPILLPWLSI